MTEVHFLGATPAPDDRLEDSALYFNREISWLAFNRRVLEEASDEAWPLLERLKFLAIFHSNLDEFFMIRVSGLHEQLEAAVTQRSADGLSAPEQLRLIREIVQRDAAAAAQTLSGSLLPGLSEAGIRVLAWEQLSPERRKEMTVYFESVVFPTLTPLAFDPAHPFPFVSNLSLSLAVELSEKKEGGPRRFARVKVPASLPRFVPLPPDPDATASAGRPASDFLLLEGLVEAHLDQLFPGMAIIGASAFRVTRDADFEIREDEAGDLLQSVTENVRRRRFGAAIRLEVEARCPENVRELLREELELEADDVYDVAGPMGLADFFFLWKLDRPDLKDTPLVPASRKLFAARGEVFEALRKGDVLVHHPYDSFDPVLRFLEDAATDPNVLAIKMTLYRTGADSPVVAALAQAAENGKQVAVLVELKARFDEENNIQWARSLERAGVHVAYGVEGLKTHGKIALVVRREGNAIRRYVHIGTGNYNRVTATVYTDLGLFTARPDFGSDASELFNFLTGVSRRTRYKKLTVAPFRLEEKLLALIDQETEKAREGKPARIIAKMNSLVASRLIKALYGASAAGVPIDLAVRGICCLRPGVAGVSETIRVSSVVGRFLEHSRAFAFGVGGEEEMYIGSADWMPRNLFRRVELMVPILDEKAREKIRQEVFEPMLADNTRARDLQSDGTYLRRRPVPGEAVSDAQQAHIDRLARHGIRAVPSATIKEC
ncbi:MAG TPA: polyphosphate kinase 1 [Thermoanaerobaculia bacterium]|nr:polyphosphate kinase 1 [Thermoanaerobaculia bacterium]